jgi:Na+-transporting NADH:ubiquinone oxidoreductase subunit NqrF
MNSRRVVLCLGALSSALLVATAPASAATHEPVIKSISPLKLKVGEKLTIKGKYFLSGKGKTRVFFVKGKGGAAYAKSDSGSTTKIVVTLPAQLDKVING